MGDWGKEKIQIQSGSPWYEYFRGQVNILFEPNIRT